MASKSTNIGSIERTLEIVELLSDGDSMGVSEVAEEVTLSKSSVFSHLNTLQSKGYLVKEDGEYRLSCRFLRLGSSVQNDIELYQRGKEKVDKLASRTGERTNLVIEENGMGTCIYATTASHTPDVYMSMGERWHMHATATGKAILAQLPSEEVDDIVAEHGLPRFTEATIVSRSDLEEELDAIRKTGISFDNTERIEGLCCIGTAIVVDGYPLGSISVSGPSSQFRDSDRKEELQEAVRDSANIIQLDFIFT